jgi:hypothetical protein
MPLATTGNSSYQLRRHLEEKKVGLTAVAPYSNLSPVVADNRTRSSVISTGRCTACTAAIWTEPSLSL